MIFTANANARMKAMLVLNAESNGITNFGMKRVANASAILKNFVNAQQDTFMTQYTPAGNSK